MHDPFSMRPFFGYNFGQYLQHWLDTGARLASPPLVFMVNWFRSHVTRVTLCSLHVVFSCRKGQSGGLLWPGFGDNIRVIEWILGAATVSTCIYVVPSEYKCCSPRQVGVTAPSPPAAAP